MECPICASQTRLVHAAIPSYRRPDTYGIYECERCRSSHASPTKSDPTIYDLIYRHAWRIPGYCQYSIFADEVRRAARPFEYLRARSAAYWAIGRFLDGMSAEARILEAGCGRGYLTYALIREGWRVTGVDISQAAVAQAIRSFGNHFRRADVTDAALGRYDVIVCPEVIEHVEDPGAFLRTLRGRLEPRGKIVLTTPDKSAFPSGAVWETDLPPVHLWWLTRDGLDTLGRRAGFSDVRFLALEDCPVGRVRTEDRRDYSTPPWPPFFDERGRPVRVPGYPSPARLAARHLLSRMRVLPCLEHWRTRQPPATGGRPGNLCAVFSD